MSIKCGHCRGRHDKVAEVRTCSGNRPAGAPTTRGTAIAKAAEFAGEGNKIKKANGVEDGFYTAVLGGDDYVTVRVRTQPSGASFAPGEQVASFLVGPDNESDYLGFAFVKPDGRFFVWKRFKQDSRLGRALDIITRDPDESGEEFALQSGRCRRCNRKLTVPASINRGFGPHCASEVGVA